MLVILHLDPVTMIETAIPWIWAIVRMLVDGLLDKSKSHHELAVQISAEILAYKNAQERVDGEATKKFGRYIP